MRDPLTRSLVIIFVSALVLSGAASAVGASGQAAPATGTDVPGIQSGEEIDHSPNTTAPDRGSTLLYTKFVAVDSGEIYTVPAEELSEVDLPAGEYVAYQYREANGSIQSERQRVQVGAGGSISAANSPDVEVRALVGKAPYDGSYAATETVPVWIGAVDPSTEPDTPVESVPVTATVTSPDGTSESFELTTNSTGQARLDIPLEEYSEGVFEVSVTSSATDSAAQASFQSGTHVELYPAWGFDQPIEPGRETTVALHLTEAAEPIANEEHSLTITSPDGSEVINQTVQTDAGGYATVTFTPTQTGEYTVTTPSTQDYPPQLQLQSRETRAHVTIPEGYDLTAGADAAITGHAVTTSGPLANEDLIVSITNLTDWDDPVAETNLTVSTNAHGQFATSWGVPDEVEAGSYHYQIDLYTSDGEPVAFSGDDYLYVYPVPESGPAPSPVWVDAEFDKWEYAPGETAQITVEVTDNGEPVANTDVRLLTTYTYEDVPADYTEVTTNETGMATHTVEIPENAPDTDGSGFSLRAATDYDGETVSGGDYVTLQSWTVTDSPDGPAIPGESHEYGISVEDVATQSGVPGVDVMAEAESTYHHASTFFSGHAQTDTDGNAILSVPVPEDARGKIYYNSRLPYEPPNYFYSTELNQFDVAVNGLDYEYQAGETIEFNYSADTSTATTAVITISSWDSVSNQILLSTTAAPEESVSADIPTDLPPDTYYDVNVWAVTEDGDVAYADDSLNTEPPAASVSIGSATTTPESTVTVPVSGVGEDVAGYAANITYDPTVVQVESVDGADLPAPTTEINNEQGWVLFTSSQATGVDNPTLADITFETQSEGDVSTPLTFVEGDTTMNDVNGAEIDIEAYNDGEVSVEACTPGDANGDGEVTPVDATLTQRHIVGLPIDGPFNADCADVNGDGSVGPVDVTLIQRIIVGLPI